MEWLRRLLRRLRHSFPSAGDYTLSCWLGHHEYIRMTGRLKGEPETELPKLRVRCLRCGRISKGVEIDGPRYTMTKPKRARRRRACKKIVVSKFLKRTG